MEDTFQYTTQDMYIVSWQKNSQMSNLWQKNEVRT